jgi:hypothetical protein
MQQSEHVMFIMHNKLHTLYVYRTVCIKGTYQQSLAKSATIWQPTMNLLINIVDCQLSIGLLNSIVGLSLQN